MVPKWVELSMYWVFGAGMITAILVVLPLPMLYTSIISGLVSALLLFMYVNELIIHHKQTTAEKPSTEDPVDGAQGKNKVSRQ